MMVGPSQTRGILVFVALSLGVLTASASEDKVLKCPIDNPLKKGEQREAVGKEAARVAMSWWRSVEKQSNNRSLRFTWITSFANCVEASKLPLEEFVSSRKIFRHQVLRTYIAAQEKLEKAASSVDIEKELKERREQNKLLIRIAPEFSKDIDVLAFTKEERDELSSKAIAAKNAQKEGCSSVDLSSRLGMPRNQTDIGWCYAFTAADLVTFKLGTSNAKMDRRISAADLGFAYNREYLATEAKDGKDSADLEGGSVSSAIKAALKVGGFCRESWAPSQDFTFGELKETIAEIEKFKLQAMQEEFSEERFCFAYRRTQELLPGLNSGDFAKILYAVGERNMEYFEALTDKNCRKNRQTYGLKKENIKDLYGDALKSAGSVAKSLNSQLDKGNIAGISFPFTMISSEKNATGYHALTVVGRRFNEKSQKCEYLLRNSWGLGCAESIKPEFCAKDHSGHLWVDREAIEASVYRINYLE